MATIEDLLELSHAELIKLTKEIEAEIVQLHDESTFIIGELDALGKYRFFRTFYLSNISYLRAAIRLVDRDDRPSLWADVRECQKQLVILRSVWYVGQPIGRA
jgi:hypothetical protein